VMNADYVTQQPLAANPSKNRTDIDSQALIVSSLYVHSLHLPQRVFHD